MSQDRFKTSREVYHQIRWDPRLDAREFSIGYDAHSEQLEEMPFEAFVPDGEIPWHRVWYFRHGAEVVWDRRKRIDTLSTLLPAAPEQHHPEKHPFTPLPSYRYDSSASAWVEAPPLSTSSPKALPAPAELTLASLNVLFDLYGPELLDTPRRTRAALSLLRSIDADILTLQEITPPFLSALLGTPWVREHFFLSEGPAATTVTPYGQVILSRFPFASMSQSVFSRDKRIIAGEIALRTGPLWVATLHLTSNVDPTGGSARAAQIQSLLHQMQALEAREGEVPDFLLTGDFNFGDDAPEAQRFADAGFVDVWTALRPGEPGYTYDPARNAVASLTTNLGHSQRFDHVMMRSPRGRLTPHQVSLFGEEPISGGPAPGGGPLFVSDHFGLSCTLKRQ